MERVEDEKKGRNDAIIFLKKNRNIDLKIIFYFINHYY